MKIETPRLILRKWRDEDVEPFYQINQDKKVVEFLAGKMTQNEVENFIKEANKHIDEHGFGIWAVELKEAKELIGFVGLKRRTFAAHFTPCVEIAWRLGSKHWNKGYATEAAREVLRLGFEKFGLKEIVSFTVPQNLRSQKVMQKIGLKRDFNGDFNHSKLPLDHPLSLHVLYRLSRA